MDRTEIIRGIWIENKSKNCIIVYNKHKENISFSYEIQHTPQWGQ